MNCRQLVGADGLVKLGDHGLHAVDSGQVVAGGKAVLSVEADAEAGVVHRLQDTAKLLELGSDVLAHAGHVLQAQIGALGRVVQHPLDGFDCLAGYLVVALPLVAAGVEYDAVSLDIGGQGHVVDQGLHSLLHQLRVGAAEVDEVDGVKEDGAHARFGAAFLEGSDFLFGRVFEGPGPGG